MIAKGLAASLAVIAAMAAISFYGAINIAPETMVPIHWNIRGEIDGYAPRDLILIGLPVGAAILSAIFAAVPLIDPRAENVRRSSGLFLSGWIGTLAIFAVMHGELIFAAAAGREPSATTVLAVAALVVMAVGNFMAKSRSSWFLGFRTPWTLTNENAWIAANRTTGWLLLLTGALTLAALWLYGLRAGLVVLLAGIFSAALVGLVVSYLVWRRDSGGDDVADSAGDRDGAM